MQNTYLKAGSLFAAMAVALGAMGAHFLKGHLAPEMLLVFETAVRYQFYHSLGLFCLGLLMQSVSSDLLIYAGRFFIGGIFLFSGSLYFLSMRSLTGISDFNWIGALTPLGGLCFIAGWGLLFFALYSKKRE